MKTLKTQLGVEFDLEIISITNYSDEAIVEVSATCEEGYNSFYLPISNRFGKITEEVIIDNFSDLDISSVEKWVDSITSSFLSSELSKACVSLSSDSKYYRFSIDTLNNIVATVLVYDRFANGIGSVLESYNAIGETEIKELLNKLK